MPRKWKGKTFKSGYDALVYLLKQGVGKTTPRSSIHQVQSRADEVLSKVERTVYGKKHPLRKLPSGKYGYQFPLKMKYSPRTNKITVMKKDGNIEEYRV